MEVTSKDRQRLLFPRSDTPPKRFRESSIISELSDLGKEDTMWLLRFMLNHLEELSSKAKDQEKEEDDPLEALDYLGRLIRQTGKTSEVLFDDYIGEKFGAHE